MMTPEEIQALREHTEMTHVQMAQLFRVRPADVIAWENGELEPDEEELGEVAPIVGLRRQEGPVQVQLRFRPTFFSL